MSAKAGEIARESAEFRLQGEQMAHSLLQWLRDAPLQEPALPDLLANPAQIQLPTLLIGAFTCALILRGARLTKVIPPTILGLIGGIIVYYAAVAAGFEKIRVPPAARTLNWLVTDE